MYQETTAFQKIKKLNSRIRAVCGGTSASKTISILIWCIAYAQTVPNQLISVVSQTLPHLKKGAIRDFLNIMNAQNYFKDNSWNKTNYTYTFENKSQIEFFSVDEPSKVRGPRRDVLFMNECNEIPFETYTQLEIRTKNIIYLDWNPVSSFWFYDELLGKENVDFITLTFEDNEGLDENIRQAILSRKGNNNWWKVYGMGLLGESENRIYKNWKQTDEIPHEAKLVRYGLDFGYTNDPSSLVAIHYWNGAYILDEILYQKGLSNKNIADAMISLEKALCMADSAEPKSIDEIKSYGILIMPVSKGQGVKNQGIQFIQEQKIYVTKRSVNLWKEYNNYLWQSDKDGKILNIAQDFLDHAMDSVRYAFDNIRPPESQSNKVPQNNFNQWNIS